MNEREIERRSRKTIATRKPQQVAESASSSLKYG